MQHGRLTLLVVVVVAAAAAAEPVPALARLVQQQENEPDIPVIAVVLAVLVVEAMPMTMPGANLPMIERGRCWMTTRPDSYDSPLHGATTMVA